MGMGRSLGLWLRGVDGESRGNGIVRTVFYGGTPRKCGPGSSVGIATGYGLGGPRIESRWERDFPQLSRPALGPTQPPVQ